MIDNKSPFNLLISKLGENSMKRLAEKVVTEEHLQGEERNFPRITICMTPYKSLTGLSKLVI